MVWLAGLLPMWFFGRRRLRRLGAVVMVGSVLMVAGCQASRLIPFASPGGGAGTPTPGGTYDLVVSGKSAGLTRSVGLTLVVQ